MRKLSESELAERLWQRNHIVKLGTETLPGALDAWPTEPTALMVVHGIGNQFPLETLDTFARGLAETWRRHLPPDSIKISHHLARRVSPAGPVWYENFLRLERTDAPAGQPAYPPVDLFEYYWAPQTENKVRGRDIAGWVHDVASQAKEFYAADARMAQEYERSGAFFNQKGEFKAWRFRLFLNLFLRYLPWTFSLLKVLLEQFSRLPLCGWLGQKLAGWFEDYLAGYDNLIGDIVVYTTTDPKSPYYCNRREILNRGLDVLRPLIEPEPAAAGAPRRWSYGRVVIAAHSLGTQVAIDLLNRLNHLMNQGAVAGFNADGSREAGADGFRFRNVAQLLGGLVTFGSPADKIAFFLREQADSEQYLRRQMLENFHCFRQRAWDRLEQPPFTLPSWWTDRLFEEIRWRNYFDAHDYVSGALDFYHTVTNVDCVFPSGKLGFTHSNYWRCEKMYEEIIGFYLTSR